MHRSSKEWKAVFVSHEGYFFHDGDPRRPHPVLTSSLHSNGFFNSRTIIPQADIMREVAEDLTEKATTILSAELQSIDAVVGPATGATILARELSKILSDQRGWQIWSASPVKSVRKEQPEILFDDYEEKRRLKNARVLLCEDVISTGGSTIRTQAAVSAAGGLMLPHVLALVNRSGAPSIGRFSIISLVTESMSLWLPEQCPLCKQGSRAIPAKDNWTELTRRYY